MTILSWSEEFSVGVVEIDDQHKKLLQLINGLHKHLLTGDADDIMGKVLDRVAEYASFHFSTEEQLMAQYAYPYLLEHKHEHQSFISITTALQSRLLSGHARVAEETMKFLKEWLSHHILESDKLLGKYLNTRGVV
jgi:hemerythrin